MKTPRRRWMFLAIAVMAALFSAQPSSRQRSHLPSLDGSCDKEHCTVVMVGKKASADGSVISTHTSDCGVCDWTWRYVPPADHQPGEMRKIYYDQFATDSPKKGLRYDALEEKYAGLEIPQVSHTYGYFHGMFGYMNDNQVAFGESTIGCREQMENSTTAPKMDITTLTMIAMERAKTAREAIQIMGDLAVKYGYGHTDSGEMLSVSDPNEIWIFEIMPVGPLWAPETGQPGAVWAAERIPDDQVSVCPNESRIGEMDLNNKDYFLASPNAVSYAVKQKFYDPASGKPFNWKRAYSPVTVSAASSSGSHPPPVALLRSRGPGTEVPRLDAQHGPALLHQAGEEALDGRRDDDPPRQERGDAVLPGARPAGGARSRIRTCCPTGSRWTARSTTRAASSASTARST